MNFQGFQSTLPSILILVIAAGLVVLAWYSYNKLKSIPNSSRWTLIILRSLSFILVLLLLLNPFFFSSRQVEIVPEIAVFLDNSESISITKNEYKGLESYRELLEELSFDTIEETNFSFYTFGERVTPSSPDSLAGTEVQTNLSAPVQSLLEMDENVKAAVIISDGIITFGRNPVISAFNSSIPIFSIGVGDTSYVRDIAVSNVITNATGYTNTNHMIEVEISQTGFDNESVNVQLRTGETIIQEERILFDTNDQIKTISFDHTFEEPGLKQFEVYIEPLEDEWSQNNNQSMVSVDVIDSRVKILHMAFAVHPDVKALRSLIQTDQNNMLFPLTWLGNNRFIEDPPEEAEFDLVIIHGRPRTNVQIPLLEDLSDTPTLLLEMGSSNGEISNSSLDSYSLINARLNSSYSAGIGRRMSPNEHSVLELPDINLQNLPDLFGPRQSVVNNPGVDILYNLIYNGVETDYPAVVTSQFGNVRRSHVLPWGWFKVAQSMNPRLRDFYSDFFTNLISWTANDPDDRLLRVVPEHKIINSSTNPVLNGFVRSERGNPEDNATIEIHIESENTTSRTFNMENTGNGTYRLQLPKLSEGIYSFVASARKEGRPIEEQQGEFIVSNTSSELGKTDRNDELLRALAENSDGVFFTYNNIASFWDELNAAGIFSEMTSTVENYYFPVRSIYWFLLLVLLLGSEWMLRKYYSLP